MADHVAVRLAVVAGGIAGTALRLAVGWLVPVTAWPVATLVANLSGALALGFLLTRWEATAQQRRRIALFGTGLLGSYTTFSALAVEVVVLAETSAAGAGAYATLSLGGGLLAALAGRRAAEAWSW